MGKFIVINEKGVVKSPEKFLYQNNFYKSYSLLLALKNKIPISNTTVLTSIDSVDTLENHLGDFKKPVMLRMDYENFPKTNNKFIGGIPIYKLDTLKKICQFLFNNKYIPVLQPYSNRFKNEYNMNCSLSNDNDELYIELAGKGFDAGDLRLGITESHEKIVFDYNLWKILSRKIISSQEYMSSKRKRESYIAKMEAYIKYANDEKKLLNDISTLKEEKISCELNKEYVPVSKNLIEEIALLSFLIRKKIVPLLPFSKDYVASISILEDSKIVLWDIYGKWYYR
jgi:hypothetical protein